MQCTSFYYLIKINFDNKIFSKILTSTIRLILFPNLLTKF